MIVILKAKLPYLATFGVLQDLLLAPVNSCFLDQLLQPLRGQLQLRLHAVCQGTPFSPLSPSSPSVPILAPVPVLALISVPVPIPVLAPIPVPVLAPVPSFIPVPVFVLGVPSAVGQVTAHWFVASCCLVKKNNEKKTA